MKTLERRPPRPDTDTNLSASTFAVRYASKYTLLVGLSKKHNAPGLKMNRPTKFCLFVNYVSDIQQAQVNRKKERI